MDAIVGPDLYIAVCVGYMIVNAMMRLMGKTCASALRSFQQCRPAGIYKRHYIQDLFKYHHEKT